MGKTIRLQTDCDYLVYLDKDTKIVGFELTPDERQAYALRYHLDDADPSPTMPTNTIYILEVFGINSVVIIMQKDEEEGKGQLLFYKPSFLRLAKEVTTYSKDAVELGDYVPDGKAPAKNLPAPSEDAMIKAIPWLGWEEAYWGTPMWMKIWKARPDMQVRMLDYSATKYEKEHAEKVKALNE